MALTNPNTPVSQQDLQDFYNKIKPYMGIYPSAMGKKIGKGDIYSTDERLIGQWIDGKPLYSKTIILATLPNATSQDYAHGIANLDKCVFAHGAITNGAGTSQFLGNGHPADNRYSIFYSVGTTNFTLNLGVDRSSGWSGWVTLFYTKTTDSAISIGDDTDYSTEEKIIGTWIDGKPVYQKTIQIGDIAVVSSVTYKNLGVTNADTLISSKLWYTFSDGNKFDSEFLIAYNYGYACPYIDYASHKIYMAYKTSIALSDMFAIIQYTKTTD